MLGHISVLTVIFLCLPVAATGAVIHVPADQPTIQAGIYTAVDGDTVLIADGVHTGDGNRNLNLQGKAITVRSENGPEACIIDCQGSEEDPHRGFMLNSGEGRDSVIEGFTIRNGYAPESQWGIFGSGIFCSGVSTSPTIRGNVITGNVGAVWGGGIYSSYGEPLIEENEITGNQAAFGGGICTQSSAATIRGNRITGNIAEKGGGICCYDYSNSPTTPELLDNTITENQSGGVAGGSGGGIYLYRGEALVRGNSITGNSANSAGGGIFSAGEYDPVIRDNLIEGNAAAESGGGLRCHSGHVSRNRIIGNTAGNGGGAMCEGTTFSGNLVRDNTAEFRGGGIFCSVSVVPISNCLIAGNQAGESGGGVYCGYGDLLVITGTTIAGNSSASSGGGIFIDDNGSVTVASSILWADSPGELELGPGAAAVVTYSAVSGGYAGQGNIGDDPLFVEGPGGGQYFLSQLGAGQNVQSPCVDASDPSSDPAQGTTRTDGLPDTGVVDMGFHYGSGVRLVTGPGPAQTNPPEVRLFPLFPGAAPDLSFPAYGPTGFGVNVTAAHLGGDGRDVILTGAGPGEVYGPHVRGFQPDGTPLPGLSFLAYGTNRFGVNVAGGDLDGDGMDEVITGAGPGEVFGPHVRAWCYDGGSVTPMPGVSFLAYGTPKWGVNVTTGDIDGDGFDEIITGAGPGAVYGPHVRGWNADGGTSSPMSGVSFFAYGTLKYGVNVACGDIDGDGIDEIITGAGPGAVFGPHVRGWNVDGGSATAMANLSFFAWPEVELRYGVNVFSGADLNGNGRDEIVVGQGPDPEAGTWIKVYMYDGSAVTEWFTFEAYGDMGLAEGASVAAGRF